MDGPQAALAASHFLVSLGGDFLLAQCLRHLWKATVIYAESPIPRAQIMPKQLDSAVCSTPNATLPTQALMFSPSPLEYC